MGLRIAIRGLREALTEKVRATSQIRLDAYSIQRASTAQVAAIREFAREQGFTDLRSFKSYMSEQSLDYYDVIKIASP